MLDNSTYVFATDDSIDDYVDNLGNSADTPRDWPSNGFARYDNPTGMAFVTGLTAQYSSVPFDVNGDGYLWAGKQCGAPCGPQFETGEFFYPVPP